MKTIRHKLAQLWKPAIIGYSTMYINSNNPFKMLTKWFANWFYKAFETLLKVIIK